MAEYLKIALASAPIALGDKGKNLLEASKYFEALPADIDIIVFPELFSTGFTSNVAKAQEWAEPISGETVGMLQKLAKESNTAVTGSFLSSTAGNIYNRGFFIEPSGDEMFYDKRHLFSMSSESKVLTRGADKPQTIRFRGWNVALVVCYDLRFPVWCRNRLNSYDALIVAANWPNTRRYAWEHLLIARAIENQAYAIGVNRSGEDKFGNYNGMSMAFDFAGKPMELTHISTTPQLKIATLQARPLQRWREEFTAWKDADEFAFL